MSVPVLPIEYFDDNGDIAMIKNTALQIKTEDLTPERKLIAMVMLQALEDLYRPAMRWTKTNILTGEKICLYVDGRLTRPRDFLDAKRWFESDDDLDFSFLYICTMLDLEPSVVRMRVKSIIENNIKCKRPPY